MERRRGGGGGRRGRGSNGDEWGFGGVFGVVGGEGEGVFEEVWGVGEVED